MAGSGPTSTYGKGIIVKKSVLLVSVAVLLAACAGPQVTRTQPLDRSADAPYSNVLVVSMFKSFDMRRIFEREIVEQLEARGVKAVASTSSPENCEFQGICLLPAR